VDEDEDDAMPLDESKLEYGAIMLLLEWGDGSEVCKKNLKEIGGNGELSVFDLGNLKFVIW
jgi:hypothetical protein